MTSNILTYLTLFKIHDSIMYLDSTWTLIWRHLIEYDLSDKKLKCACACTHMCGRKTQQWLFQMHSSYHAMVNMMCIVSGHSAKQQQLMLWFSGSISRGGINFSASREGTLQGGGHTFYYLSRGTRPWTTLWYRYMQAISHFQR